MLWSSHPARWGGLILDAAYPIRLEADPKSGRVGQARLRPPDTPAVKSAPIYVLVGEVDQGGRGLDIWRKVEPQWRKAGVPLTIHPVPGKGHQWLVGPQEADALEAWLKEIRPKEQEVIKPCSQQSVSRKALTRGVALRSPRDNLNGATIGASLWAAAVFSRVLCPKSLYFASLPSVPWSDILDIRKLGFAAG